MRAKSRMDGDRNQLLRSLGSLTLWPDSGGRGEECCSPQGSVGPASGPDATRVRPEPGTTENRHCLVGRGHSQPVQEALSVRERTVRCTLQISACFCSLQVVIDAKRRAHKDATTLAVPSRRFPDPDKVAAHQGTHELGRVSGRKPLPPFLSCLDKPPLCADNRVPERLVSVCLHMARNFQDIFADHVSVIIFVKQVSIPFFSFA
jgi:hypothetical protein